MKDFVFSINNLDLVFSRLYSLCEEKGFSFVVVPKEKRISVLDDSQGDVITRIQFIEEGEIADLEFRLTEYQSTEEEV